MTILLAPGIPGCARHRVLSVDVARDQSETGCGGGDGVVDQAAKVWAEITARAHQAGAPVSLRHAIAACADCLAAVGAGLVMVRDGIPGEPLLASSPFTEELEELQSLLGEGPCMDAAAGHGPVLVADLAGPDAHRRWPVFAPAAVDRGVRGMFAFPVAAGAALVGVLDVYRKSPGTLLQQELADALTFADAVLLLALDSQGGIASDLSELLDSTLGAGRSHVHQATGMVAAQLEVSVADALAALRAYAFAHGRRLGDVAADVLDRRVRFAPDADNGPVGLVPGPEQPGPEQPGPEQPSAGKHGEDGGYSVDLGSEPGQLREEE